MKKIISYNVNGIRAAFRKGFINWLAQENPDILCIQETKAQPDQIDSAALEALGYHCYWFSAQKKGYSGVGILSKEEPKHIEYGMEIEKYDREGRMLRADFDDFSVLSIYHPSGTIGKLRQAFKIQFLDDFRAYVNELQKQLPNLILSGDYNICRLWIDIHNPAKQLESSGFLWEERKWFDDFLKNGFTDSFRYFNHEPHHYSWWSYRTGSRQKNLGWRIDYHITTQALENRLIAASILPDAMHSDHCPITLTLK